MTCRTAVRRPPRHTSETPAPSFAARPLARRRAARGWLAGAAIVLVLGLAGPRAAHAAPGADPAQRLVDAALQDTLQVFGQTPMTRDEASAKLRRLLDQYVDLPRIGRDSLGAHWRRATAEQQAAFLDVFERFLCVGYSDSAMRFGGLRFGPTAVVERDDGATVVRADAQLSDGSAQPVLFVVGRSDDGTYRIMDVIAAAISMSRLLSADFVAVLHSNGGQFDALIGALANKASATAATP